MVLINVHAPTEDRGDDEKEEFFGTLDYVYDSSTGINKIIVGDLNAKVGRESEYRTTTEGYSLHEDTNNNGNMLIDFATEKTLSITDSYLDRNFKGGAIIF